MNSISPQFDPQLKNQIHGRFKMTGRVIHPRSRTEQRKFEVTCLTCGNTKFINVGHLRRSQNHACLCPSAERTSRSFTRNRIYDIWLKMKSRCLKTSARGYHRYGGRGISICDEWLASFQAFYEWSLANGYSDTLTIDRRNNDLGYAASNCRWATAKEQSHNSSSVKLITAFGETKCYQSWADDPRCSITSDGISRRLKVGIPPELAITVPAFQLPKREVCLKHAADTARAALRAHLSEIERLKGLTADYEDACRQANDALVVAERRARQQLS